MTATVPSPTPISIKTHSPSGFARWQHDNAPGPAAPAATPASLASPTALSRSTSAALSDLSASSSSDSPVALAAMAATRPSHSPDALIADPSSSSSAAAAAALADSIQNLSLDEDAAREPLRRRPPPLDADEATAPQQQREDFDVAASISKATEEIAGIKSMLFELEEKRHANVQTTSDEMELAVIRIDDRLEAISRIMQQLIVALRSDEEDGAGDTTIISHHDDEGSDSDDDHFALPGVSLGSHDPKLRFEELAKAWDSVQDEVETFKKELRDDKYISHFHSASSQAEELMDSLDKALTLAANFIDGHRAKPPSAEQDDEEARDNLQRLHAVRKTLKTKRNYYYPAIEQTFAAFERSLKERATRHGMLLRNFSELKTRWRDLRLKTSKMERELKRIEAAMTGEGELAMSKSTDNLLFLATPSRGGAPQAGQGRLTPGLPAKSRMRTTSSASARAGAGPSASASAVPPVPPLSPPVPPKPLKSTRRMVSGPGETTITATSTGSPMRSGMTTSPSASSLLTRSSGHAALASTPSRHNRSASSGSPEPSLLRSAERLRGVNTTDAAFRSSPLSRSSVLPDSRVAVERSPVALTAAGAAASTSAATPSKRVSHTLTSRPPSSFRFRSKDEGFPPAPSSSSRLTPQRGVPPRSLRAGSEPPLAEQETRATRPMSALAGASPRAERRMGSSGIECSYGYGDDSMETLSVTSSRPGSATGSYYGNYPSHYRPPSSATTHVDPDTKAARRQSRIPTFTFPGTPGSSSDVYEGGIPRPGSSMSQASSSAGGSIATPRRFGAASRSTMQTPEPIMAARVQRLSVYSKPSTGGTAASTSAANRRTSVMMTPGASSSSSRPPTTRSNPRSPASSILSSSSGSRYSTSATSSTTAGRTTPLSASALAKIPHARPLSVLGTSSGAGGDGATPTRSVYAQSIGGGSASSVANYRTSRSSATASNRLSGLPRGASSRSVSAYAAGGGGGGSTRDGAATPTFSERSGHSSYSYAPAQGSAVQAYRPNPLDALDVAVSTVTNALGVPLTRVDPHLPRGVKTETGPGKEVRCRYSFGGGAPAICKLLELHRATVEGGVQRKVLVKVPGKGFLDLELWLLSAFD